MNLTLTVRGTLEDDPALQEIVSILYRKTAPEAAPAEVVADAAEPKAAPLHTPDPEPQAAPAEVVADAAKPAVENPEFAKAVDDMVAGAQAPAPKAAAEVAFKDLAKAASDAMNRGQRDGFSALLNAHGAKTLAKVDAVEWPALLEEIEAL